MVLLIGVVVLGVLGVSVLSAIVPGMDGLLASVPVVMLVLLIGTVAVLWGVLRHADGSARNGHHSAVLARRRCRLPVTGIEAAFRAGQQALDVVPVGDPHDGQARKHVQQPARTPARRP